MKAIRWSDPALGDLARIRDYLGPIDRQLAQATIAAVRDSVRRLRAWPESGPIVLDQGFRKLSVTRYRYVVVYRIEATHVIVLRVRHMAEDWQ